MQIHQIQVSHDPVQDRLLLRVGTQGNEEFRVWITRRFLRQVWPVLATMLAGHLAPVAQASRPAEARDEAPPSFEKPFRDESPSYPLGSAPLLASEARLAASGPGAAQLSLREGRERSFNLTLDSELMQALCAMLRASTQQAEWDLALDYDARAKPDAPEASTAAPAAKPGMLH